MRPAMPFEFIGGGDLSAVGDAYCSNFDISRTRRFALPRVFGLGPAAGVAGLSNASGVPGPDATPTQDRHSVTQKRR
jgi:hypothetical protein